MQFYYSSHKYNSGIYFEYLWKKVDSKSGHSSFSSFSCYFVNIFLYLEFKWFLSYSSTNYHTDLLVHHKLWTFYWAYKLALQCWDTAWKGTDVSNICWMVCIRNNSVYLPNSNSISRTWTNICRIFCSLSVFSYIYHNIC